MEMGLSEGRKGQGEGGRAKVEGGRAKGRAVGGKGWKRAGNLKNFAAPPSMRLWCDPQLGDEGKVLAINMRRIF